jgi:beta-glucosidase
MLPYQNPDLSLKDRLDDLISRLTLEEKALQMQNDAPAVDRISLPAYNWWNECLHGVGRAGRATVFPQAIGLAATWNPDLVHDIAAAISDEARAKHHAALKIGNRRINLGLTYWSPTINILRDPRWGRAQETYGEDPMLTGRIAVAFIKGLQGSDPKYLKLVATSKHFAAHSGPEKGRSSFDAQVSPKDLEEVYLPHFEETVREAGAQSFMGAYNRLNGEPCCASETLLKRTLREKWGFEGFVVSDCGAIENIWKHHKTYADQATAAAAAVKAGCDLCCGNAYASLPEAVERGLITEAEIDVSLRRLFRARFQLGMFDPEERVPYSSIPVEVVNCRRHRDLAKETALQSIVLLKNDGTLPLRKDLHDLSVCGPTSDQIDVLLGNYNGLSSDMKTILEGVVAKVHPGTRMSAGPGCVLYGPEQTEFGLAGWEATTADAIVGCFGFSPKLEGEEGDAAASEAGGDRTIVSLPPSQISFLRHLLGLKKPLVLVLTGGSPIALPPEALQANAILFAWYPGEEGGPAVADILFGDASPAGRLPVTFPKHDVALPPLEDYAVEGRTYRYSHAEPQYPFGYGLSYTQFSYSDLAVEPTADGVEVSATVRNTGSVPGDEVVQVYVKDLAASVRVPMRQLVAFRRVHLNPGEEHRIGLLVPARHLSIVTEDGARVLEPGEFEVFVGGGQPGTDAPGVPGVFTV